MQHEHVLANRVDARANGGAGRSGRRRSRRGQAEATVTPRGCPGPQPGPSATPAGEIRNRLRELLRQYPPAVSDVLRLSPGLLTEPSYLEPYPALAAFLADHPDIAQNPGFYFGTPRQDWDNDTAQPGG